MKIKLSLLALVGVLAFNSHVAASFSNTSEPIVVVVNTADWCGTCKKHEARVQTEVLAQYSNNPNYIIVILDSTTDETKAQSNAIFQELGILELTNELKYSGVISFIRPSEMRVVDNIGLNKSNESIIKAFKKFELVNE